MTDEQVKKGLEEIALKTNWGSVERIDGVPKSIAVIKDALAIINRLEQENDLIGKQTAKEILQSFAQFRAVSPALSATWYTLAEKYGVTD